MEKREIKTEVISYVTINKSVFAISKRCTKKGVKTYLHAVNEKVYNYHEISKDLALKLLNVIKQPQY